MRKTLFVIVLLAGAGAASAAGDDAYVRALEQYDACHYREAVEALREAASDGNERAAQMLGTMLLVGPRLYGDQVARDPVEGLRWLRAAASAGNEIAQFQVARLAKGH